MTHPELVKLAEKWLLKKCGFAFRDLSTDSFETPDAIGFKGGVFTILIECKVSRSDFFSDKKKSFRIRPETGMGAYRYYMCPKGLIKPEELPEKWGLLYVNEKGKIRQKVGPKGNIWSANMEWLFLKRNTRNEMSMMYSALRRLKLRGVMNLIYDKLE